MLQLGRAEGGPNGWVQAERMQRQKEQQMVCECCQSSERKVFRMAVSKMTGFHDRRRSRWTGNAAIGQSGRWCHWSERKVVRMAVSTMTGFHDRRYSRWTGNAAIGQ